MLFAYLPKDGVYLLQDDKNQPLHPDLYFRFPETSHPLNISLANFFQNRAGFFNYDAEVLYTKYPYQIITLEKFPELQQLALRINYFTEGGVLDREIE